MATYAKMKGKVTTPGTSVGRPGNTRNQPDTAPVTKAKVAGPGLANTFFHNSRKEVHKNLSVKGKHD